MDDDTFSKKANISVINRFDKEVKDIIISASQVALYVFEPKKTKWIKRKVEGACFFYRRKCSPKYGIFILNRLDTTNFIELMYSNMEIQLQEPYILYRNIFNKIYGIWFYEKSECTEMAAVFQRILKEIKAKEKEEQEEEYAGTLMKDKACTGELLDHNGTENSSKPNGQPDSVRQFFAKASKEATKCQPSTPQQPSCSKSLCSSFQSVAHIEKAQKSDQQENVLYSPSAFDICARKNYQSDLISPISRKVELFKSEEIDTRLNTVENNLKSMNVGPSIPDAERFPQNFLLKQDYTSTSSEFPELIPPGMLLTPSDLSASVKTDIVSDAGRKHIERRALSKKEMIDAMEYLLKNDSQFADKLYDAYLKTRAN